MTTFRQDRTVWVIYDHPRDYPKDYVARKWIGDECLLSEIYCAPTVDALRELLRDKGLHRLPRHHSDNPIIVESWL